MTAHRSATTPGGLLPRGNHLEPYRGGRDFLDSRVSQIFSLIGHPSTHHFFLIKIILIILNCCIAVKANVEGSSVLEVGDGRMQKLANKLHRSLDDHFSVPLSKEFATEQRDTFELPHYSKGNVTTPSSSIIGVPSSVDEVPSSLYWKVLGKETRNAYPTISNRLRTGTNHLGLSWKNSSKIYSSSSQEQSKKPNSCTFCKLHVYNEHHILNRTKNEQPLQPSPEKWKVSLPSRQRQKIGRLLLSSNHSVPDLLYFEFFGGGRNVPRESNELNSRPERTWTFHQSSSRRRSRGRGRRNEVRLEFDSGWKSKVSLRRKSDSKRQVDLGHQEWTSHRARLERSPDKGNPMGCCGNPDHLPTGVTSQSFHLPDHWQRILFAKGIGDDRWKRVPSKLPGDQWLSQKTTLKSSDRETRDLRQTELRNPIEGPFNNRDEKGVEKSEVRTQVAPVGWGSFEKTQTQVQYSQTELNRSPLSLQDQDPQGKQRTTKRIRQKRKIEMLDVSVVEGNLAALPCDLTVEDPKDSVQLILWIKEGIHTPLYSYDYRELLGGRPREIRPDANSTLSRRTTFRTNRSPAALLVERTEAEDAGVYRCRVDFLLSPTVNRRINLTVIVPPSELRVSWQLGNSGLMEVLGREAGPFLENSQPSLVCFCDDGWPLSAVSWYEGDELLDDSYNHDPLRAVTENELLLPTLTRDDLGRRLTCQASNSNQTLPTTITVTIAMTLSIIGVEVEPLGVVWAEEETDVECHVWGSRPSPSVVWWLGSQMIPSTQSIVLDEGNETISVLNLVPRPRDDGIMLTCQATNEKLPDQAVQDSILLTVNYAPVARVILGRSLNPDRIREGDDVYFECSIKSKPPVLKVTWKHNGEELMGGKEILVSNMSLVVQGVTREHAGNYTCHGTNIRNTTSSPPLYLDVKYAPVCTTEGKTQYSVAKLENAEIPCRVHSNPSEVTFRWTFNNTTEAVDVPDGRFVVLGTESRVNYTPVNDLDYGTLLCWATNAIGVQQHPCVFHIVAAGKPDPPHNCRVFDVTVSSLQVTCLAGDDGGLTQNFSLEVYQIGSLSPIVEVSRSSPAFSVSGLRPATAYKIIIAASNDKGSSKVTELKAYTIRVPETPEETNAEPTLDQSQQTRVPIAVAIGLAVALVPFILLLVAVMVKSRICTSCTKHRETPDEEEAVKSCQRKEVTSAVPVDETNPDIISHTPADPPAWEGNSNDTGGASTKVPTTDVLPNGGGSSAAAVTSSSGITKSSQSRVSDNKHSSCTSLHHPHVHDTTCLNTSLHTHTCHGHAAAMPQVPYYTGIQQQQQEQQVTEMGVPTPPSTSCNHGCVTGGQTPHHGFPTSFNPLVATLGRKKQSQGGHHSRCPHAENVSLKYVPGVQQQQQVFFPHIFQRQTPGLCMACQVNAQVQDGIHCSMSHIQAFPNHSPPILHPQHHHQSHHGSHCSLAHGQGLRNGIPSSAPPVPAATVGGYVHLPCEAKKVCGASCALASAGVPVAQSPHIGARRLRSEEGKNLARVATVDSTTDPSTASSSPSAQSTRESTV